MLELYEWPPTRSQRAKWALEELGLDFTSRKIDMMAGEQKTEAYRAIHPLGVVPALKTDHYTIFESVAIVMQLVDENPDKNLAPVVGSPERALYYQWCVFACAEMDPAIMMYFDNTMRPTDQKGAHDPELAVRGRSDFGHRADILSKTLSQQDYMLGDEFSGADILIGHSCFMATLVGLIGDYPQLQTYYNRLQQRPAFKRVYDSS